MAFLPERDPGEGFQPFAFFRQNLGFVPNLFKAQTLLPRVIEAETRIAQAILLCDRSLSHRMKERLLLCVSHTLRNTYCVTAHHRILQMLGSPRAEADQLLRDPLDAGLTGQETALLRFALKLSSHPTLIGSSDLEALRRLSLTDEQILETVLVTGLTRFLCTLSSGLGVTPDFDAVALAALRVDPGESHSLSDLHSAAYFDIGPADLTFPPFAFLKEKFGFVPAIFRAQKLFPEALEAETGAVRDILLSDDILPRKSKEFILLAISALNLNTYCVAVHCEMLRALGVPPDVSDAVAVDHRAAGLSAAETMLLDFALKLASNPSELTADDISALRSAGHSDEQVLEAIVMCAMTQFLNTVQMGVGSTPDFPPRRVFRPEAPPRRETSVIPDPDAEAGRRARAGDTAAFLELAGRHHQRICRMLFGILGDSAAAEECTRRAFLRALESLSESTEACTIRSWLTRIGISEGLRQIEASSSLHDDPPRTQDTAHAGRRLGSWDEPEKLYSAPQLRLLVREGLGELPLTYRLPVLLRDVDQLTIEETADALGCDPQEARARLHQGRMLLREILTPRFARTGQRGSLDA